ncbi:hypothetical protein BU23DRAFT_538056 [Bimuria novae-zelandiae CBS 107.79]|uniref:Ribosome assembly protein 3 n=1 Tax=Bimuria novae-zelandiae CBS 107.79 TaxID=1447943 RepID=A0A6A5UYW5_9PLEO|nr:hypothetical protein BU23DRAFT_538056 [Bimuria novae-zelandiae CBS 107.79]
MAPARGAEKSKRKKKRKSRTQVETSSDSDSDVPQQTKKPAKVATPPALTQNHADVSMNDAPSPSTSSSSLAPHSQPAATSNPAEEFPSIYLRKVTVELADDLDKVRNAADFKVSSLPMLVHALRQGASVYSGEERRRFVGAAN